MPTPSERSTCSTAPTKRHAQLWPSHRPVNCWQSASALTRRSSATTLPARCEAEFLQLQQSFCADLLFPLVTFCYLICGCILCDLLSVLRSIRVESPLTSVDFTLDGTGLVVGSTQGKIYQYDLRNSSSPTRIIVAHKTSVTCLRFQSNTSRVKVFVQH